MTELTEMAGVAEAETQAAYAWALDYDDPDESPTQPIRQLTSRRITALSLAASLVMIAVAGAVMLVMPRAPEPVVAPATPAAVLDGVYRYEYAFESTTVMGTPLPSPKDDKPEPDPWPRTAWRAFRSTCTPAGCTATSIALDDKNHQIASTPLSAGQWRFTNGQWQRPPEKSREKRELCGIVGSEFVPGEQTLRDESVLTPQPDGTLRGLLTTTVISSECGSEGMVWRVPYTVTRVGDVSPGLPLADPSTVSATTTAPAAPVIGPVLDGTYRIDYDSLHVTGVDPADPSAAMNKTVTDNSVGWAVFQSICTVNGCVAAGTILDDVNHQESANPARPMVFRFTEEHWVRNEETLLSCGQVNRNRLDVGDDTAQTIKRTTELTLRPDGILGGVQRVVIESNECGVRGVVITTPVTATRMGPVSPNIVLADPALFV